MTRPAPVAVVIPARDALPHVHAAIESAKAQTRPPAEIVVVDDHSVDGTGDEVAARHPDVRVIRGAFGSAAAARNAGWRATTSEWVAWLDADDVWRHDKLAVALATLEAVPEAEWFFSDGAFQEPPRPQEPSWFARCAEVRDAYVGQPVAQLIEVNFVLTSSVVVSRAALEATGGFDESMTHAEDLDLWIRLARSWPVVASRVPLVRYQHLPGGLTRQVERRLEGDVRLFDRLAKDPTLPRPLRGRARRREAMVHFKLAVTALRDGRREDARRELAQAWHGAGRLVPVGATWLVSLMPTAWLTWLRGRWWTSGAVGARWTRLRRVRLSMRSGARRRASGSFVRRPAQAMEPEGPMDAAR